MSIHFFFDPLKHWIIQLSTRIGMSIKIFVWLRAPMYLIRLDKFAKLIKSIIYVQTKKDKFPSLYCTMHFDYNDYISFQFHVRFRTSETIALNFVQNPNGFSSHFSFLLDQHGMMDNLVILNSHLLVHLKLLRCTKVNFEFFTINAKNKMEKKYL